MTGALYLLGESSTELKANAECIFVQKASASTTYTQQSHAVDQPWHHEKEDKVL